MVLVLSVPTVLMSLSGSLNVINTSNSCKVSEDTKGADVSGIKHGGAGWHRVRVGGHDGLLLAGLHKATGDLLVLLQPLLSLRLQVVSLLAEPLGHGLSELWSGVLKVNLVHSLGFISLALSTSQVEVSLPSFWWRSACIAPG